MSLDAMDDRTRGFEEERLAWFIARRIYERASGQDTQECILNLPHDRYFIGNFRPKSSEDTTAPSGPSSEFLNKLAPVAFGAEFRLQPTDFKVAIHVRLRWACYYRVFPTLEQQLEHQRKTKSGEEIQIPDGSTSEISIIDTAPASEPDDNRPNNEASPEVTENARDRRKSRMAADTLFIRFKKISCEAHGTIHIEISGEGADAEWSVDKSNLQLAIDTETVRAQEVALADPENLRTGGDPDERIMVDDNVLTDRSGKEYSEFCKTLPTQVVPEWKWTASVVPRSGNIVENPEDRLLEIQFVNESPIPEKARNFEGYLFEVEAGFGFENCAAQAFEFELAPRGFRYSTRRFVPARGFNCNVVEAEPSDSVQLITTSVPVYRQQRYQTRSQPVARFHDLATQPIPVLETILASMRSYLEQTWGYEAEQYAAEKWWNANYQEEYERSWQTFDDEIRRFAAGLELIRTNADVHLAFTLTNETFKRGGKQAWRLFQIVFLVTQIPGIVALAEPTIVPPSERQAVDIIYFPTGGGKTEAYLATIVFHCFFDRLRGKRAGVTAWTRFPLRLLTLQQTQRVADVMGLAEIVRREQKDARLVGKDVAGFAVGYFVGSNATPNKLKQPFRGEYPESDWLIAQDPNDRQQWKRIVRCPSCRTNTVIVDFDEENVRLRHRCTQPNCKFDGGYLPVYIVDNEIYRYLPAVIVGTIDKLAGIGNQHRMSLLFGKVDGYCQKHGYYLGKCCQDECDDPKLLNRIVPQGLSGPTLFVQDELHLLKEGLGTFDAHYETFAQRLLQEFGHTEAVKIIASSATIEAFERQVEHLYGRDPEHARVFPGLGPTLESSFYAETLEYPQRLFLGIIPHNKTIFNAILELVQYYHEIVQDLQRLTSGPNPYDGQIEPGTADWRKLLDFYATSLTYFLNTRELYSVKTDLESAVNTDLEQGNYRILEIAELTGSVSTSEVARTLERLEQFLPEPGDSPDTILATNMISHGVDVDRLNSMLFYGMPSQVAEYIQSSSRVGRSHVGLVFMCLHPARERDQSHYIYFSKFHEFLGRLVEPVAINRWSRFSVTRTLPGLFMAILLQIIAGSSGEKSRGSYTRREFIKKQISDGKIRAEQFIPILEQAYGVVDIDAPGPNAFREEITKRVNEFFDQVLGAGPHIDWVSEALIPQPMRSLRDVDEQLSVELDDNGTRWAARQ
jgi:hypothetical protein